MQNHRRENATLTTAKDGEIIFNIILPSETTVQALMWTVVILIMLAAAVNGYTLLGLRQSEDLSWTPRYTLLKNLILSDILLIITQGPTVTYCLYQRTTLPLGIWCFTQYYVNTACVFCSLITITCMALERYLYVCQAIHYLRILTFRRMCITVGITWLFSLCLPAVFIILLHVEQEQDVSLKRHTTFGLMCEPDTLEISMGSPRLVAIVRKLSGFSVTVACLLTYCFSYLRMYQVARNVVQPFQQVNRRARNTVLFYCGMLLFQLLPVFIKIISDAMYELEGSLAMVPTTFSILTPSLSARSVHIVLLVLLLVPPCINPLVYSLRNPEVYQATPRISCCRGLCHLPGKQQVDFAVDKQRRFSQETGKKIFIHQPDKQLKRKQLYLMDEQEGWSLDLLTKTTCRSLENNLQFICEFPADAPQAGDGQEAFVVKLPAQCNVHQLRLRLCMLAQERSRLSDPLGLLDPERYRLLYTKTNDLYEIYDDCQVLQTLSVPWFLDPHGMRMTRISIREKKTDAEDVPSYQQALAKLIGYDLNSTSGNRLSELSFTRRKLASPRREELKCRDWKAYAIEPWTTTTPLPKDLQEWLERKLPITVYFDDTDFCVNSDIKISPDHLLKVLQETVSKTDPSFNWSTFDAVLKVCGREEYLVGNTPLYNFLWVRSCLKKSQDLHLTITDIASLPEDTVRGEACPLVDNLTSLSSFHEDLALDGKEMDEILMISLWDCERKFRVKLVGFDVPELPIKAPQNVRVEASIIYGNKVLSSVCSTPKGFADELLWNTWLEFDILLKNIPRGSKLGFTINAYDSSTAKESKSPTNAGKVPDFQRCKGNVLYFVNLQLIDHRSVLSQGPHILHMWPFPEREEEVFTFEADKLSTATNPDVATSMAITFLLDRYSFPIVIPHSRGIPNTLSPPSVTSPTSNSSLPPSLSAPCPTSPSKLDDLKIKSPTSSPTVAHRDRLRRFREESVRYTSNLPQFLRSIDWLNPDAVQDIHWLLGHWQPHDLELAVALELLSVNFADERVRGLAVQRLELLSNEEVLRYLLQLVQTLKVEPYHDSSLARFLIQRALRSKRIGHFFFWYLRSEVAGCPFFRERMAVILEAYLMGCGQAMLSSFQQQVQVVDNLHDVASAVKRLYPDKSDLPPSAAQKLQDLLQSCSFPPSFQVPFDPRIRAGQIQLDRCKIMASKKKPLWLEFSCVDSHASASPPVGIIFKQGDDLRQDMLVIQTLNVMDSIWQERSLNLNLVPYGCISTGYNIGMIEIVRDAVTIAAVQRSQGGNKGAFKNDALFEWLKDNCPLQEIHYQAMERFVNSCAGYCVATYVLGIGDRHNDNIMITDKGNLFHIDFGHILGNTKSFLGMNRERVPFVLTPDFLYVMGRVKGRSSLYFQRFRDICIEAYLSLRSQSRLLVTLFSLMLLTGIPELSASQDMRYLRTALQEERGEEEARHHFLQQIAICEQLGWTVQANWWFHMVAGIK
ncbi:hypothetical protein ACEWY4_000993 [Coilia grayii]|uniref:phosphatidylinositol 3-kinase n=1 Tax=Coilia grayii TaxID=363190 RepID=A0ABD1KY79_9TELE